MRQEEIYFSSTEGVTIHLTDPTFAVNITGKIGGPVSSILANIFSLGKPKRGQDAKIIDVHSEKTANFVTELRMLCVQSDKHVIAADQVAVVGSKGSTPFSTKFPRDDRTSNDLVSIKNNDPIHILGIFTVLKPVKNSYRFVNCWVPNQKRQ